MKTFFLAHVLMAVVLGMNAAKPQELSTMPRVTAHHFCQLMVCDNDGQVTSLASFLRKTAPTFETPDSSLQLPQAFCTYVFCYDGWQSLRIFPHINANQTVTWHAANEQLPDDIDPEHKKYIHDVFPRLIAEVQAGNWKQVDAYIDRMAQYQCQFGSTPHTDTSRLPVSWIVGGLFLLFLIFPILMTKRASVSLSYIIKRKLYEKDYRDSGTSMPRGQGDSC